MSDITTDTTDASKPAKRGKSDQDILSIARKRLDSAIGAFSVSRSSQLDDLKFAAGSSDNKWQWPPEVINSRLATDGISARPCLTINKLPQHIKQVTNDQRQNRPSGKVVPVSGDADQQVADVFEGIVRHIEKISSASLAYDTACENQVMHGEGYWRILTKYADKNSFEQDIFIQRIRNSFSVYMDPMIQIPWGEDAKWCIITEELTKEEYEDQYPDASPISSLKLTGTGDQSISVWIGQDTVRIAEYFYIETVKKTLNLYPDGSTAFDGEPQDKALKKQFGKPTKTRQSDDEQVKWIKTNGFEILESRDWPGKYIPVVRVVGNEFEVEGEVYLSGIVRNAKDPQRMYNYWTSQEAEMLALAPKAPFIGYGGQFEGFEKQWKTANVKNWPYLEVNPDVTDGNGGVLPLPQRAQPPLAQQGLIAAKDSAGEDIKDATGQYNASLGQTSNERSGKAILARQHEGDISTFHYGDNLAQAMTYSTRQIVDLIPKIYDTQRVARMVGEDGSTKMAKLNPDQQGAVAHVNDPNNPNIIIEKIYNPSVGKYDVDVVTGPGYATKRQEALDSMGRLLEANPELWKVAGDLFAKNMDWPGAMDLAKRLAKTIPPQLTSDEDTSPALQQAQQQIQQMGQELQQAHQMLQNIQNSIEAREVAVKEYKAQVDGFDAETRRITATAQAAKAATQDQAIQTPEQIQDVVMGILHAAIASGHIPGTIPGGQQASPQEPPQPAPSLDPNKVLDAQTKLAMQANQHAHEASQAQFQAQQPQLAPGGQ